MALLAFGLGVGATPLAARAATPRLTAIEVIPLRDGINTVQHFAPDGRAATIVQAWRDNGNAHGYSVWLVTLPASADSESGHAVGLAPFDGGKDELLETIGASPFDGERVLETVRFARAKVDGAPAAVVIRAALGESASGVLADHAPVDIDVYQLDHPGVDVGTTPDVFRLVSKVRAPGGFCNADMALATLLHLPLPANYAGGKMPDGCL